MQQIGENVSIKIKSGVYGAFRNLVNKPWYALGEFVDNAVQSFENNKSYFRSIYGNNYSLEIKINIDKNEDVIKIKDNATILSDG